MAMTGTTSIYSTVCLILALLIIGVVYTGLQYRSGDDLELEVEEDYHIDLQNKKDDLGLRFLDGELQVIDDALVQHFKVAEEDQKGGTNGEAHQQDHYRWGAPEPDVTRNATELITSKGYPCENHYVTTADGYILNLQRIPHGRHQGGNDTANSTRPVILLQHGLFGSSTNWIDNPANQSLGFILADAGADVWLGNSRGTTYSQHVHYNPNSEQFWNFTWDDMASLDLPAVIYHILNETSSSQIYYAGHSQGTTIAFAEFSQNLELASHIKQFFALAPIARIGHAKTPIRLLAPYAHSIEPFLELFGHGKFGVNPEGLGVMTGDLCQKWVAEICESVLFVACGFNYQSMNSSRVPVYLAHGDETSVLDILKWAQEMNSKQFQKFDYGSPAANMKAYNQTTPPLYNPANIKVPVMLLRGGNDWLASDVDVAWLKPQLNVSRDIYIEQYEHLDLIWAFDAPTRVYKYIVDEIFPH